MTKEELNEKYGFKVEDSLKNGKLVLPEVYSKWLPAVWVIQSVWGHVEAGNISLGKARELTSAIIEDFIKHPEEY